MTIKICFQMLVWQDNYVLSECLKSILPYGPVIVTEGPVAYYAGQGFGTSTDGTNELLAELVGEQNVVHGVWREKDDMMNAPLHLVPEGTTHLWEVDADEIWKAADIERILELLEREQYDSLSFHMQSFYGGFARVMQGFESKFNVHRIQRYYPGFRWATHRPPTILAPDGKSWREHKHLDANETEQMGVFFYHYSYVFPSQMRKKAQYYAQHSPGGTIPDYFNRVFKPWLLGDGVKKALIESAFEGVHDWLPERRGACVTVPFTGEHPEEIRKSLPALQARLDHEIGEL